MYVLSVVSASASDVTLVWKCGRNVHEALAGSREAPPRFEEREEEKARTAHALEIIDELPTR